MGRGAKELWDWADVAALRLCAIRWRSSVTDVLRVLSGEFAVHYGHQHELAAAGIRYSEAESERSGVDEKIRAAQVAVALEQLLCVTDTLPSIAIVAPEVAVKVAQAARKVAQSAVEVRSLKTSNECRFVGNGVYEVAAHSRKKDRSKS